MAPNQKTVDKLIRFFARVRLMPTLVRNRESSFPTWQSAYVSGYNAAVKEMRRIADDVELKV